MTRWALSLAGVASLILVASGAGAAATPGKIGATPIGRLPFPERGYVLDLPRDAAITHDEVRVAENGLGIADFDFTPLSTSGLRYGAVLAIDASDSMKGAPETAAVNAARRFVSHRGPTAAVGIVAFNGGVSVLQRPTNSGADLGRALAQPPTLAYGTRIFDAVTRSLALLKAEKLATGSIVLLSDGSDVGSRGTLAAAVEAAKQQHVRIFTVGLKSGAFDAGTLKTIAAQTGGTFVTSSATDLARVYGALSSRLASEYLVQYKSAAAPRVPVSVEITIAGIGTAQQSYTAPTPSGLPPFHRSFWTRLLLNPLSALLLALIVAAVALFIVRSSLETARSKVVERVLAFAGTPLLDEATEEERREWRKRTRAAALSSSALLARRQRGLAEKLDIGRIQLSPGTVVGLTAVGTVLGVFLLALISVPFAIFGFGAPLITKALIDRKVRKIRADFADQLPPNLQVLASALRAGHSFIGAFVSCVDNADEPSKSELSRAITDEQLGVPLDDAIRKVGVRMNSRDLEQVALLAELQRTTGGNAAEMLDVVVATIRERADLRRLVQTLTAQGRMARWILTALPIFTGLAFWAINPSIFAPLLRTVAGQILFAFAGVLVIIGSLVIQRIVEIEV